MDCDTTVRLSYTSPSPTSVRVEGRRQQLLKEHLYEVISSEVQEEHHPLPPPMDFTSTTKTDFGKGYPYLQQIEHTFSIESLYLQITFQQRYHPPR